MHLSKNLKIYWIISFIFVVFFGEVLSTLAGINPMFLAAFIPITIYYVALTFLFSLLFEKAKAWQFVLIVFVYGGTIEVLLFKGIPNFLVAGLFYVFLFGVPYLIVKKIVK